MNSTSTKGIVKKVGAEAVQVLLAHALQVIILSSPNPRMRHFVLVEMLFSIFFNGMCLQSYIRILFLVIRTFNKYSPGRRGCCPTRTRNMSDYIKSRI